MLLDFILGLIEYFLFDRNRYKEAEELRKKTRKVARDKLSNAYQDYKKEFGLFRGHTEVIKIRNPQRKYEFDLHIKTEDGTFPFEKIYGLLSMYDNQNKKLKWDIEDYMPNKDEDEPYIVDMFQEALKLLDEDRGNLEGLKSEIRPFVEQSL